MKKKRRTRRAVARNKQALRDYEILETVEAGIVLMGSEVKSLRRGDCSFTDTYARIRDGEAFLVHFHIKPYAPASIHGHEPTRTRKLLLHAGEIERLAGSLNEKGLTLIPLDIYFKRGFAKVTLGLGRGRRQYDKRERLRKREHDRDIERALRRRR